MNLLSKAMIYMLMLALPGGLLWAQGNPGPAPGGGGTAPSGNLVNELAALQSQIDELKQQLTPSVAGSSYRVYFSFNTSTVLNWVPQNSDSIFNRVSVLHFYEDGTGLWDRLSCTGYSREDPDYLDANGDQPVSVINQRNYGCSPFNIEWEQTGNELTFYVIINGARVSTLSDLWVSRAGEVIVKAGNDLTANQEFLTNDGGTCDPDANGGAVLCTLDYYSQFLRIAIRLN